MDELIQFDQRLLLALNGSDSLFWDHFMTGITSTVAWLPVAVVLIYVIIKNNSMREVGLIIGMVALAILVADQFSSSFCKPYFARFRPAQDPQLMYLVDVVDGYRGGRYGFISSHAANTFAVGIFLALLIRHVWVSVSLFLWAALCSYSRIYLGVHYPGDIFFGMLGDCSWAECFICCMLSCKGRWLWTKVLFHRNTHPPGLPSATWMCSRPRFT